MHRLAIILAAAPCFPVLAQSILADAPLGLRNHIVPDPPARIWDGGLAADLNADDALDFFLKSPPFQAGDRLIVGVIFAAGSGYTDPIIHEVDFTISSTFPGFSVGDWDGNTIPDLFVRDGSTNRIWVLPFTGTSFGPTQLINEPVSGSLPSSTLPPSLVDFDGDARADLIVTSGNPGRVSVRFSTQPSEVTLIAPSGGARVHTLADFTGDGQPDLMVTTGTGEHALYPGTGSAAFGNPVPIPFAVFDPEQVDWNADGLSDLVGVLGNDLAVLINTGDGQFDLLSIPVSTGLSRVDLAADLNSNGLPDLLIRTDEFSASATHQIDFLWLDPANGFNPDSLVAADRPPAGAMERRDVDGDGLDDVLFLSEEITVWLNRGGTAVPPVGAWSRKTAVSPLHVLATDLNADEQPEFVVTGTRIALHSLSDGHISPPTLLGPTRARYMSLVADLDGDGYDELVTSALSAGIEVYPGQPDGFGPDPSLLPIGAGQAWQIAVRDLDGDDLPDVIAADPTTPALHILGTDPAGNLRVKAILPADRAVRSVGVIDLNGVPTIIAGDGQHPGLLAWNRTASGWAPGDEIHTETNPATITTADIDADGLTDILIVDPQTSPIEILFADAGGLTQLLVSRPDSTRPYVEAAVADLTGDLLPDLLLSPTTSGERRNLNTLIQVSPRQFEVGPLVPVSDSSGVTVADADQDGLPDIISVSPIPDEPGYLQIFPARPAPCPADRNADATTNAADIAHYLNAYLTRNPNADLAAPLGTFNFFDVATFLAAYNAGCP